MITTSSSALLLLPAHRFTTGDEVEIRNKDTINNTNNNNGSSSNNNSPGGVITEVTDTSISIALFSSNSSNRNNNKSNNSNNNNNQKKNTNDDNINDNENDGLGLPPFTILARSNIEVHNKIMKAIDELEKYHMSHPICGSIVRAVFEDTTSSSLQTNKKHSQCDY